MYPSRFSCQGFPALVWGALGRAGRTETLTLSQFLPAHRSLAGSAHPAHPSPCTVHPLLGFPPSPRSWELSSPGRKKWLFCVVLPGVLRPDRGALGSEGNTQSSHQGSGASWERGRCRRGCSLGSWCPATELLGLVVKGTARGRMKSPRQECSEREATIIHLLLTFVLQHSPSEAQL